MTETSFELRRPAGLFRQDSAIRLIRLNGNAYWGWPADHITWCFCVEQSYTRRSRQRLL